MFVLIERYIERLTLQDLNHLAMQQNIYLSADELEFSYDFIKKNWKTILSNHGIIDIDKYKNHFSEENFLKIKKLIKDYSMQYGNYLK